MKVRPPAVAGSFYPADAAELRADVERYLLENPALGPQPKALIAPHAGYIYSGPVAARAYNLLQGKHAIRRVVLIGPSHRVPLRGLAAPSADAFRTPFGDVPLDRNALDTLSDLPQVVTADAPHAWEHSLEVHLPFLQHALGDFTLVPLAVGIASPGAIAEVLNRLWDGEETLIVASSDLSHYHPYDVARRLDEETCEAILARRTDIGGDQACGCHPVNGLLEVARRRGLSVELLDLRNSGDTAGPKDRVVGYGAFALHEPA